jgi:hypothetical protein
MIAKHLARQRTPADLKLDQPIEVTVRVPLDKRRIAQQALAGLLVTLATTVVLILMALGIRPGNDWQVAGTCFALAGAIFGALRGMRRLQDADPGLVVGPHGLRIRSNDGALQSDTIPWSAIQSVETRGRHGRPYVALHLRDPQRYAPATPTLNPFGWIGRSVRGDSLAIAPQFLRIALPDLEALLRRYFDHYSTAAKRS